MGIDLDSICVSVCVYYLPANYFTNLLGHSCFSLADHFGYWYSINKFTKTANQRK